ncbi:DNA-processing protein DprA [Thermodesulfobacteriota bacterium]
MTRHSTENVDRLFDWLALERIPRVGPLSIARLLEAFGSPREAMKADAKQIRARTGLSENLASAIAGSVPREKEILNDIETLHRLGAKLLTRWDEKYPTNLRDIYDPPALLFVRGEIIEADTKAVAMVGTRKPSHYGLKVAMRFAQDLASAGITVISGLAKGIDTACHKAALEAGGRTIGVLGCGIDVVYPKKNRSLVEDIVSAGAVITEFRPGLEPLPTNFYRRNRVVSGLSKGVVVVQSSLKSGSLITANHAVDQGREVFAVPGSIAVEMSRGPHKLLKEGAALAESAQEIIETLFAEVTVVPQQADFGFETAELDLTDTMSRVLAGLDPDPIPIDLLCESLKMAAGKLSGVLLELELKGLVKQYPGKQFGLISK